MVDVWHVFIGWNKTEFIVSGADSEHRGDFPRTALLNILVLQRKKLREEGRVLGGGPKTSIQTT